MAVRFDARAFIGQPVSALDAALKLHLAGQTYKTQSRNYVTPSAPDYVTPSAPDPIMPAVKPMHPPRFDIRTHPTEFLSYLEEHGFAVVAGVADSADLERGRDLMWHFLEHTSNGEVQRSDVRTWEHENGWVGSADTGIIGGAGVGQAPFMWHLRLLPRVREAFAAIWGVCPEDLVVSFDGANVFRPWQYAPRWRTRGGWYHVDQNAFKPGKAGRCCVQGLVTLTRADASTGGLTVVPGSHKHFVPLCERNARQHGDALSGDALADYVSVAAGDEALAGGGRLLRAEAGDLVLWDSRTIHCNSPALEVPCKRSNGATAGQVLAGQTNSDQHAADRQPGWELLRMVGYVCMTPAAWATDEVLSQRWDAFVRNATTTHWPHTFNGAGSGPLGMPKNDPASVSVAQHRLIGAHVAPPQFAPERPPSEAETEARRLLMLAEEAEGEGNHAGAARLYRRAFRLDPALEATWFA